MRDNFALESGNRKHARFSRQLPAFNEKILPSLAHSNRQDWPVREDHCFQRIVLDTICGDVWYKHLDRPAYKNLTHEQAYRAVRLCHEIAKGHADLRQLNNQSLIWRGKR